MIAALVRACVRGRVAAIVITLVIGAWGFSAMMRTPIEAYPDVTNVQVNVVATMPGLAPEEIERQLTIPLERALNGTPKLMQLRSESLFGLSLMWLVFEDDADAFKARMYITERLMGVQVPDEASVRVAPDATPLGKVYYYRVNSPRHSLPELRTEQEWTITRALKQVPGVADVVSMGGFVREFHIEVDPERLGAYGLTLVDVNEALEKSNRNVGGGVARRGDQQLVIRGIGRLARPEDIKAVVLEMDAGTPVTIGDVAKVMQAYTPRQGSVSLDDERDIVQGIVLLRRGENPDTVLDAVHARIAEINAGMLPEGMYIEPMYDRSVLIEHTLHTVRENLLNGFLLVAGMGWLFLRSIRGSLIVAITIPLALVTAFAGLYALQMPANLISMGAIDFGIIVDAAVVLVENVIHEARHRRPTKRKEMIALVMQSAVAVSRPAFYSMGVNIVALIPMLTLESVEGRIFRPMALTYGLALFGALCFSLTVVPALCAVFLRPKDAQVADPKALVAARSIYRGVLTLLLRHRSIPLLIAAGLLVAGVSTATRVGTEFLPELDEGDLYVFAEMPASISLESGQDTIAEIRAKLLSFPEVTAVPAEQGRPEDGLDNEGINMVKVFARLKPKDEWREGLTKDQLIEQMRAELVEIPGVRFNFSQPIRDSVEEAMSGVRGKIVLKVFGTELPEMRATLMKAIEVLEDVPGVVDLGLYRDASVPQLRIDLDREALARSGITVDDVEAVIETAMAGVVVTEMWEGERLIPVRVRLPLLEKSSNDRVGTLLVPTPTGGRVPLRELAKITVDDGRAVVVREGNRRTFALKFNIEGRDMGSTVADAMEAVRNGVEVPDDQYFAWGGEFENQNRAMAKLKIWVPVAVVVMIGLLYAALGSGWSVLAILVSVPFALTGGLFALRVAEINLSVSAAIGFIALMGQVSMAGLLMISGVDERRAQGLDKLSAVIESGVDRFRARVMTGLLALCGLMPMAISTGMGSETQRPFALVIVGGMVTTLVVALLVLPTFYTLLTPDRLPARDEEDT
jgi:heavy metal efflux system protein